MEKLTKEVEMILIEKEENQKPVEFKSVFNQQSGWVLTDSLPKHYKRVIYLGRCRSDGDMFAAYDNTDIIIFRGHLNSGKY